jgi:hypothetical protein
VNDGMLYSISKKGHDMMDVELGLGRPSGRRMMASKVNADARRHFPSAGTNSANVYFLWSFRSAIALASRQFNLRVPPEWSLCFYTTLARVIHIRR